MYNLLIVDDEKAVVDSMAYDIDWSDLGITEIFRAYSGQQALDCFMRNRVDIVISDIRMPELSGLELAKNIRGQWPYAKIIFISGYDEFQYAQKAIDLGVTSYITKPASYEELIDAVDRAIREIEIKFKKEEIIENAEKQLKEIFPIIQERYLNALVVQGVTNQEKDQEKWKACQLELDLKTPAFLILIRIDGEDIKCYQEEALYEIALRNLVKDILLKSQSAIFFKDPDENQVVIVQRSNIDELKGILRYVEAMAGSFQSSVENTMNCTVSITWSEIVLSLYDIHVSYLRTLNIFHRTKMWGSGIIAGAEQSKSTPMANSVSALSKIPSIITLIQSAQMKDVLVRIEEIFGEVERKKPVCKELLLEIYYTISLSLVQASVKSEISLTDWAGEDEKKFSNFDEIRSVYELKEWCIRTVNNFLNNSISREAGQTNNLIERVKGFILQNLCNEISLTEIAAKVYLHPNYLSRLFKDLVGVSITEFIIKMRMEKAKEILAQPGMKVYEAANYLGYESNTHFSRIFKRVIGMSPKEYQSQFNS